jgi:hypothetical protein
MAGANSVASVDPASTTKSYTKPTVYIAPAASITQSGELLRLAALQPDARPDTELQDTTINRITPTAVRLSFGRQGARH